MKTNNIKKNCRILKQQKESEAHYEKFNHYYLIYFVMFSTCKLCDFTSRLHEHFASNRGGDFIKSADESLKIKTKRAGGPSGLSNT